MDQLIEACFLFGVPGNILQCTVENISVGKSRYQLFAAQKAVCLEASFNPDHEMRQKLYVASPLACIHAAAAPPHSIPTSDKMAEASKPAPAAAPAAAKSDTGTLVLLFVLWYAFNAYYNVSNKLVVRTWFFPYTCAFLQVSLLFFACTRMLLTFCSMGCCWCSHGTTAI